MKKVISFYVIKDCCGLANKLYMIFFNSADRCVSPVFYLGEKKKKKKAIQKSNQQLITLIIYI